MEKGALFSGDIRLAFPWNGQETCGGVGKISDGKWLPLILRVSIGPAGHFRSIKRATVADTRICKTAKQAAGIAISETLDGKNYT